MLNVVQVFALKICNLSLFYFIFDAVISLMSYMSLVSEIVYDGRSYLYIVVCVILLILSLLLDLNDGNHINMFFDSFVPPFLVFIIKKIIISKDIKDSITILNWLIFCTGLIIAFKLVIQSILGKANSILGINTSNISYEKIT